MDAYEMKIRMRVRALNIRLKVSEAQISNIIKEANENLDQTQAYMENTDMETKIQAAFIAGAFFGLENCEKKT